jgi:hypothetical protein
MSLLLTPYPSPLTPVQATALDLLKCCKETVLPACASGPVATMARGFLSMAVYLGIATLGL